MKHKFCFILVKLLHLTTPNRYDYKQLWYSVQGKTGIVFKVKASNDAHVALSTVRGNTETNTYEIVISGYGNTKSSIRKTTQVNICILIIFTCEY